MTEQAKKTPSGANAPYKIVKVGDKWAVKNNTGDTKATFDSYAKALAYQRALYANVPGAPKRADKVKYSGKAKDRVAAGDLPEPHPYVKPSRGVVPMKKDTGNGGLTKQIIDTNPDCVVCGMKDENPIHNSSHPSNVSPGPLGEQQATPKLSQLAREATAEGLDLETAQHTGVMVALFPPDDVAQDMAIPDGESADDLHVTLAYLGKSDQLSDDDVARLKAIVEGWAHTVSPVDARVAGVGYFSNPDSEPDEQDVTYASIDAPDLPTVRQRLVDALGAGGFTVASNHGFTPHMTLAYDKVPLSLDSTPIEFTQVTLAIGDTKFSFPLTAPDVEDNDELDSEVAATDDDGTVFLNVDGKKKYPIKTAKDAKDAYALRNNGKGVSEQQVLAHIRRACKKLGIALPPQMQGGEKSFDVNDISVPTPEEVRRMLGEDVEIAKVKKTRPGTHRFVGKEHVKSSVYKGAGWMSGICGACGGTANDPDHDGDMDAIGDTTDADTITTTAAADDDAAKMAQGLDAAIDQALVLLRSTPDLPEYAAQARDLLQGVEETCDALLEYFGVPDADDPESDEQQKQAEQALSEFMLKHAGDASPETATSVAAHTKLLLARAKDFGRQRAQALVVAREAADRANKIDPVPLETIKAFLTEANGKTILTAPASTRDLGMWEKALTPNEHMLWIQGRFVGADEPNRNGAFWSSQDLERGAGTVPYGPLNWLHDGTKIIGCIADQRMVYPDEQAAAEGLRPHIAAVSAMYRWIYPEEAAVIEMAADRGQLWYSMECISKEVACVGDLGCGRQVSYMDYLRGNGCDHMTHRTGVRQLIDPTFLGGAVIVPPARPGWADADATLMRQAASYAEQAVAQMGTDDLPGFEVERLLAEVLRFANKAA